MGNGAENNTFHSSAPGVGFRPEARERAASLALCRHTKIRPAPAARRCSAGVISPTKERKAEPSAWFDSIIVTKQPENVYPRTDILDL